MPRQAKNLKGDTAKIAKVEFGQDRAKNTVKLRRKYTDFAIKQQINGQSVPPFKQWAKQNFPDVKILE